MYKLLNELNNIESVLMAILLICLGALLYKRAVDSRKYYKCTECGESFRVELMEASHCKTCGARVFQSGDSNVTDKA
jgi:DNA-directed RNA polymerase subunit RPC12/RpoP